MEKFWFC